MKILRVDPGLHPQEAEINGSLESMQNLVGGLIQAIYPFEDPVALVCNEEGKLLGLPLNRALKDGDGDIYDIIAGTFFLCGAPLGSESFTSLEEDLLEKYCQRFYKPEVFLTIRDKFICIQLT